MQKVYLAVKGAHRYVAYIAYTGEWHFIDQKLKNIFIAMGDSLTQRCFACGKYFGALSAFESGRPCFCVAIGVVILLPSTHAYNMVRTGFGGTRRLMRVEVC